MTAIAPSSTRTPSSQEVSTSVYIDVTTSSTKEVIEEIAQKNIVSHRPCSSAFFSAVFSSVIPIVGDVALQILQGSVSLGSSLSQNEQSGGAPIDTANIVLSSVTLVVAPLTFLNAYFVAKKKEVAEEQAQTQLMHELTQIKDAVDGVVESSNTYGAAEQANNELKETAHELQLAVQEFTKTEHVHQQALEQRVNELRDATQVLKEISQTSMSRVNSHAESMPLPEDVSRSLHSPLRRTMKSSQSQSSLSHKHDILKERFKHFMSLLTCSSLSSEEQGQLISALFSELSEENPIKKGIVEIAKAHQAVVQSLSDSDLPVAQPLLLETEMGLNSLESTPQETSLEANFKKATTLFFQEFCSGIPKDKVAKALNMPLKISCPSFFHEFYLGDLRTKKSSFSVADK